MINEEDPDWIEYHKQVMSPRFGRCMLKVWQTYWGDFKASITTPKGARYTKILESEDAESAKQQALEWSSTRLLLG